MDVQVTFRCLSSGTSRSAIPSQCASFDHLLHVRLAVCTQVELKSYEGETHTSPLIENPMRGGHDQLVDDILAAVGGPEKGSPTQSPLCPAFLINAAARVCPF